MGIRSDMTNLVRIAGGVLHFTHTSVSKQNQKNIYNNNREKPTTVKVNKMQKLRTEKCYTPTKLRCQFFRTFFQLTLQTVALWHSLALSKKLLHTFSSVHYVSSRFLPSKVYIYPLKRPSFICVARSTLSLFLISSQVYNLVRCCVVCMYCVNAPICFLIGDAARAWQNAARQKQVYLLTS